MQEQRPSGRKGRGVWEPDYASPRGLPWLHAIAHDDRLVAWLEYGPVAGRTRAQANARLWRALHRFDPIPQLTLVKPAEPVAAAPLFRSVSPEAAARVIALTLAPPKQVAQHR